jgi:hypothetical protein
MVKLVTNECFSAVMPASESTQYDYIATKAGFVAIAGQFRERMSAGEQGLMPWFLYEHPGSLCR